MLSLWNGEILKRIQSCVFHTLLLLLYIKLPLNVRYTLYTPLKKGKTARRVRDRCMVFDSPPIFLLHGFYLRSCFVYIAFYVLRYGIHVLYRTKLKSHRASWALSEIHIILFIASFRTQICSCLKMSKEYFR